MTFHETIKFYNINTKLVLNWFTKGQAIPGASLSECPFTVWYLLDHIQNDQIKLGLSCTVLPCPVKHLPNLQTTSSPWPVTRLRWHRALCLLWQDECFCRLVETLSQETVMSLIETCHEASDGLNQCVISLSIRMSWTASHCHNELCGKRWLFVKWGISFPFLGDIMSFRTIRTKIQNYSKTISTRFGNFSCFKLQFWEKKCKNFLTYYKLMVSSVV